MSLPDQSMGDLPVEVMVDILSRLPVKTIIHSKCVCKKWLDIISDSYFANLHLSRSPTNLVIHHNLGFDTNGYKKPGTLTWVDLEDELDHHDPRMTLDLNLSPIFQNSQILPAGSVNGLICLWQGFS
ncbi:putative F-box protein At3g10240 isoform X2 [Lactuca sativa]|uniref:putative F-box protein At3g10240 isoform X2 n=1 Tax=Lactuca sativa TaxID=4236 RepID=UPI001C68C9A5|nr:putative F-box protein At3g10240 isoform X2 [Lactuca sativa]